MEMLEGKNIGVLPFKELKKVTDLIFYEGPILTHFRDAYGTDILFYWVDFDNNYNRWLVFQISELQLYEYLLKIQSLHKLFEHPVNNVFYSVEIGKKLEYNNINLLFKDELPVAYYPEENTLYAFEVPQNYENKIEKYRENLFIDTLLEDAIFLKAKPANLKNQSLVGIIDAKDFLNALGESFMALLSFFANRDFIEKVDFDKKKITEIVNNLKKDLEPTLLKVSISSFAIAINSNHIKDLQVAYVDTKWKKNLISDFKNDVIDIDQKNDAEIAELLSKYPKEYRNEIYQPVIDLYNNKKLKIEVTNNDFVYQRKIKPIAKKVSDKIITPKKEKEKEELIEGCALVKYDKKTGRISYSGATLFDQNVQPVWSAEEIRLENKTYKLSRKIYADYKIEDSIHLLDCLELGIFVYGDNLPDAEKYFFEEFEFIYERYNSLENDKLTMDLVYIKETLNRIVKVI